jgi:hypothetical protein
MNPERHQFLNLRHLPGRLNVEEAAWYLGFSPHEIPRLTKARLLKPLGKPSSCATKVYSLTQLRKFRENEPWLDRASEMIFKFWRTRNQQSKRKRKT